MNMTRKNFLRWSAITTGGLVFGTALPACGGGGGDSGSGGSSASSTTATFASAAPAAFAASLTASRVSGVAPLYVNFDANGTTHPQIANPTHDLFYSWTFGDASAGNWANGVQSAGLTSKNAAFGPVTGHVFETPGTYVVNLIVMDGANTVTKSVSITVQDPNTVYAGANTICISHSGNFAGAPSGAQQVNTAGNTDMYAAFNTYKGSNKRILFCKSDTWTCTSKLVFTNLGGMTISGYGAGGAPATFGSGTLVRVNPSALAGALFSCNAGNSDLRICNFKISADRTTSAGSLNDSITGALFYKVEIRGCSAGFSAYPGGGGTNNVFDQHCMYECLVDDLYGYAGVNTPRASCSGAVGTPGVFAATAHPFQVGYVVQLTGTPPAPLATGTNYFISATSFTADTFTLSTTSGGAALALSGTGTCTVAANGLGGGISAFVGLVRGGVMGCYFDSCNHGEQTLRIPYIDRGHINNNYIARPNQGKNVLKIHSFIYSQVPLHSEKFVITANVMDLRNGYSYDGTNITQVGDCAMIMGNGGGAGDERVRNGIVQSNITYGSLGNPKNSLGFIGIGCPNVTVRNNIADFSVNDRATSHTGPYPYTAVNFASVATSTDEQTTGVRIYNNTLYSNLYSVEVASFVAIQSPNGAMAQVDRVDIKNNIWYLPFLSPLNTRRSAVHLSGSPAAAPTNITHDHNTDNNGGVYTSPGFVNTPPVLLTDWRPTAAWTRNNGATVPVLHDFNMASRIGGAYDMGAVLP